MNFFQTAGNKASHKNPFNCPADFLLGRMSVVGQLSMAVSSGMTAVWQVSCLVGQLSMAAELSMVGQMSVVGHW